MSVDPLIYNERIAETKSRGQAEEVSQNCESSYQNRAIIQAAAKEMSKPLLPCVLTEGTFRVDDYASIVAVWFLRTACVGGGAVVLLVHHVKGGEWLKGG